jgi:hypothetical protein
MPTAALEWLALLDAPDTELAAAVQRLGERRCLDERFERIRGTTP